MSTLFRKDHAVEVIEFKGVSKITIILSCFVPICKILFSVATISFFQLLTDIHQDEIGNPVETDMKMAAIDDETDKDHYCKF